MSDGEKAILIVVIAMIFACVSIALFILGIAWTHHPGGILRWYKRRKRGD